MKKPGLQFRKWWNQRPDWLLNVLFIIVFLVFLYCAALLIASQREVKKEVYEVNLKR